jgi:hypothetical protein
MTCQLGGMRQAVTAWRTVEERSEVSCEAAALALSLRELRLRGLRSLSRHLVQRPLRVGWGREEACERPQR